MEPFACFCFLLLFFCCKLGPQYEFVFLFFFSSSSPSISLLLKIYFLYSFLPRAVNMTLKFKTCVRTVSEATWECLLRTVYALTLIKRSQTTIENTARASWQHGIVIEPSWRGACESYVTCSAHHPFKTKCC